MKPNPEQDAVPSGPPIGWRGVLQSRRSSDDALQERKLTIGVAVWIICIALTVMAIAAATLPRPQGIAMMTPGQKAPPHTFAGIKL